MMKFLTSFGLILLLVTSLPAATLSGYLTDSSNGEPLIGGNVYIAGTDLGSATNSRGYYVIASVPAGTYEIHFRYIGYETHAEERTLTAGANEIINVELTPATLEGKEVRVIAEKLESDRRIKASHLSLKTKQLTEVPQVVEPDLFRAVQALPGVSTLSDFSSGLYIRGGSADQNLILIDDIDVYNPNHLFGFFSTFNVDAVKTVELQKGGFGARHGGRLSSLLNVYNKDGNRKRVEGVARISLLNTSLTLEGPWSKGSWMISGRRSYVDQTAKLFDYEIPYYFYDFHAKVNYDISHNNALSFSTYLGQDQMDWETGGLNILLAWGNDTFSTRWTHLFSSKLYSQLVVAGSWFESDIEFQFQDDFKFFRDNNIRDYSIKYGLTYTPNSSHMFDAGLEMKNLKFEFKSGWHSDTSEDETAEDELEFNYDGLYTSFYVQDHWTISPLLQLQPGLRFNYYSEGDYFDVAPRLSVRYMLTDRISSHVTYGRYYQYLNIVSEEGASFADLWFPVDETVEPGESDHYIVGLKTDFNQNFDLEIEAYYKPYNNLVELDEEFVNSIIEPDAQLSDLFNKGEGEAYGGEIYLKNNIWGFSGWLGYTLGWTKRIIEDYNFDKEYPPKYDRRHQLVIMENYQFNDKWRLNLAFKYGSGQPMTRASARYSVVDINGREEIIVLDGEKNAYRLPDYHRLDLGLYYTKKYQKWTLEPYLQVINVYNNENVYIRTYDAEANPIEYEDVTMLPLIPTIGVNITF